MITTKKMDSLLEDLKSKILDDYETIHEIVGQHIEQFTHEQRIELVLTILGMDMPTVSGVDRVEKAHSQLTNNFR